MVSKSSTAGLKKSAAAKPALKTAAKTALKTAAKAKSKTDSSKNLKETEVKKVNTQVPVKADVDPVKEVLDIKSQNESKKNAKAKVAVKNAAAKSVKEVKSEEVAEPKGSKAQMDYSKSKAVKNNAKKAAVKKFNELKEEETQQNSKCCCCCELFKNGILAAWGRGYKNIFTYKARTSRYELWSFMLINFIVILAAIVASAIILPEEFIPGTGTAIFVLSVMFIEFLVHLALIVRRLHDAGYSSWRGYFKPLIITFVLSVLMLSFSPAIIPQRFSGITTLSTMQTIGVFIYVGIFFVSLLSLVYYVSKTAITAFFFEEEKEANAYGEACFADKEHKSKALRFAALFYMIASIISYLISLANMFLYMM